MTTPPFDAMYPLKLAMVPPMPIKSSTIRYSCPSITSPSKSGCLARRPKPSAPVCPTVFVWIIPLSTLSASFSASFSASASGMALTPSPSIACALMRVGLLSCNNAPKASIASGLKVSLISSEAASSSPNLAAPYNGCFFTAVSPAWITTSGKSKRGLRNGFGNNPGQRLRNTNSMSESVFAPLTAFTHHSSSSIIKSYQLSMQRARS